MQLLSISQAIDYHGLEIHAISEEELVKLTTLENYHYIIIHGGDGTIRRIVKILHQHHYQGGVILNPLGSFNVIAKLHRVPPLAKVLDAIMNQKELYRNPHPYYRLNHEIFLFSAGNMGDLQHILLSETLRFGFLAKGSFKYLLSFLFLLPLHLIMTPFMLFSSKKFFIFTPFNPISKFANFYGKIKKPLFISLETPYNLIELDGDIVTIKEKNLEIYYAGVINIIK